MPLAVCWSLAPISLEETPPFILESHSPTAKGREGLQWVDCGRDALTIFANYGAQS